MLSLFLTRCSQEPQTGAWSRSRPTAWTGNQQIAPSRKPRDRAPKVVEKQEPASKLDADVCNSASGTMQGTSGTTVVNVRKAELRKVGYRDIEDWLKDPKHVYIGRDMTHYVPGAVGSKWGNPFIAKKLGRDECCKMYRDYILSDSRIQKNGKTLLQSLDELKGKTLGCWCHPERCHGHVLVELINEYCK